MVSAGYGSVIERGVVWELGRVKATVRFMLLMPWGRVGSNLLVAILRQLVPMKLDNERFNQLKTDVQQKAWLNEFYEIGAEPASRPYIGSKQNVLAIRDFDAMRKRLADNSIRVVRLRRDNIVKTAISQMRAEQYAEMMERETGRRPWAIRPGDETLGPTAIDPDILVRRIELIERMQERLMTGFSSDEVLDLEYEAINNRLRRAVRQLCRFLDVPFDRPFRVPHIKATPDDLETAVTNFGAIKARLAGTRHAAQLLGGSTQAK